MIDSNTQAALDFARKTTEPKTITVTFEGSTEEVLLTTGANGEANVTPVRDLFADRAAAPIRRKGTIVVHDLASFIATTNRDSNPDSAIFADVGAKKVTAILDFHQREGGAARWGQDRIEYGFTLSPQIRAWIAASQAPMDQKTFAKLIDDRLGDIASEVPAGSMAADFAARRGIRFAEIGDLVMFTRTIAAKSAVDSEELYDDNTGDVSVQYKKKNDVKTPDGKPVLVPPAFAVMIPILCGKEASVFTVAIRLRYEIDNGTIRWRVELNALEKYVLLAVDAALEFVRGPRANPDGSPVDVPGCGLPVFMGVAPAV